MPHFDRGVRVPLLNLSHAPSNLRPLVVNVPPDELLSGWVRDWKGASSVGQRSIEKFGGRLRGSNRSSSSLAEKVSGSSDRHQVREGATVVICANRSRANRLLQRAGASDVQMAMCLTSKLEGGLPSRLGGDQGEGGHRMRRAGMIQADFIEMDPAQPAWEKQAPLHIV